MGFGVYYIYPAFYTDCTEELPSGPLGPAGVDLGGVYFDLLTALALVAAYAWTRQVALLAGALAIDWEILDQFSPVMRYDGYWALADLVGVPDFYSLLRPVLASAFAPLPRRFSRTDSQSAQRPPAPPLKGWCVSSSWRILPSRCPSLPSSSRRSWASCRASWASSATASSARHWRCVCRARRQCSRC